MKKFRAQWGKMTLCRRFLFLFMLGILAAGLGWVALASETDSDGDGISDAFELFFGLDPTNPADAMLHYDEDTLNNLAESVILTDPFVTDTDRDRWHDGIDSNPLSRAYLPFNDPRFIIGDFISYAAPDWLVSVYKIEGHWLTNPPCWYVHSWESPDTGSLNIDVNRDLLTNDVVLALTMYDHVGSSFYVDLVNSNNMAIALNLFGNLVQGRDEVVQITLSIPLETYSDAVGICLRRGTGEVTVYESLVYIDKDGDGLDADQEAQIGTSDAEIDSDGDGLEDYDEVFSYGTNPLKPDLDDGEGVSDSEEVNEAYEDPAATEMDALVQQQSANFIIPRSVLDGGGKRQSSMSFVLEDSLGQPSAIGLSSVTLRLNAGYQQAENPELFLRNIDVDPNRFNPDLGEFTTLSYVLSTCARSITITVYDHPTHGTLVRTLVDDEPQDAGLHAEQWDGTNDNGDTVDAGNYWFRITAISYEGKIINRSRQVRVERNIAVIRSVFDTPDPFFPASETTEINYTTDAPAGVNELDVTIEIESIFGLPVAQYAFMEQPIGSYAQEWDGTDASGNPLADGLYIYRINAAPPNDSDQGANEKEGTIVLVRNNTETVASIDENVELRYQPGVTIYITEATAALINEVVPAIINADPFLLVQSRIYDISADPSTSFDPPAILTFKYDPAISGDIGDKLQIRIYNDELGVWEKIDRQFIDFANHQIIAEIDQLTSLFALFTGEDTTPPVITIISPEEAEYYHTETIDIIYEVEDEVAGVEKVIVYLNGEEYTDQTINLSGLLGENILTVVAYDNAGNISRASVRFTVVLEISLTLKPEALKVNPGILTAFVGFPEEYDVSQITDATCDGASYERMMPNDHEMIIKFRRSDIEEALAEIGEQIDIHFVVRGTFTHDTKACIFKGTDDIKKIVD